MSSATVIEFYQKIRSTPAMWAELAEQPSQEALIARVETMSAEHGFTISRAEISASVNQMDTLINEAADDDSLTDDELEMVAAGVQKDSDFGVEMA